MTYAYLKHLTALAAAVLVALPVASPAFAQAYPAKAVRIIVPFPPGGGTDIVARVVAEKLAQRLGQPFLIENRAGAGGTVGSEALAKATADGYTLGMATSSTHGVAPSVYPKLGYDPVRDFTAVTLIATTPFVLAVNPSLPVKSVSDLIALAKRNPGKLNYGSAGNGSGNHLATELFNMMANVKMTHIPYKGTGPALVDLIAGQLDLIINDMSSLLSHINAGKLRAVAVMGGAPNPALPGVPTASESGLPGYEGEAWFGLLAPSNTPGVITALLYEEITNAMRATDLKQRLRSQGLDAIGSTGPEFQAYMQREVAKWAKVVKATGTRID